MELIDYTEDIKIVSIRDAFNFVEKANRRLFEIRKLINIALKESKFDILNKLTSEYIDLSNDIEFVYNSRAPYGEWSFTISYNKYGLNDFSNPDISNDY